MVFLKRKIKKFRQGIFLKKYNEELILAEKNKNKGLRKDFLS